MHPHFRTSALVLRLMFVLPRLLAALPSVSSPPEQSTVLLYRSLRSSAARKPASQYNLAVEYLCSNPAAPDYRSVIKWLSASATQGNVQAEFLLGYVYEHGEGTERDDAKAAENYQAAAIKGYAANNLATLYHHWQRRSQGSPQSSGMVFSRGRGRRCRRSIESWRTTR